MKREKNYNLELLRIIACFFVVCIHVSNYYCRGYAEISKSSYLFAVLIDGICRIAVPLFFMISGALLLPEAPDLKKNIRRIRRMLVVLVVWSIVYYFWNQWYRGEDYDFVMILNRPVKLHLWYLYVLIGIYLILPFLQKMVQNLSRGLLWYFVGLWVAAQGLELFLSELDVEIRYPIPVVGTFCYLGYFVLGYILQKYGKDIPITPFWCYWMAALAIGITVVVTAVISINNGEHYEDFFEYRNMLIALGAAMIFILAWKKESPKYPERIKGWIDVISRNSFAIYLSHILYLDVVKQDMNPLGIPSWLGIPVFTIGIFIMALVGAVVFHRCLAVVGQLQGLSWRQQNKIE